MLVRSSFKPSLQTRPHLSSFEGCTTPVEATSSGNGTSGTASSSITTSSSNDWIVNCLSAAATGTPFSGQTQIANNATTSPLIGMSYKQIATGQATSTGWTLGTSAVWAYDTAAFTPATTSTNSFAYDDDGNVISTGNATETWNYRNQLTQSVTTNGTSTYAYDYLGNRVRLVENAVTTTFPTKFYSVMQGGTATTSADIFANGLLLATVGDNASGTVSSTMRYVLSDQLNDTNLVTNSSGTIVETLDYYPYGQARMDTTAGNFSGERRKFIREEFDSGSEFNYLNARFYNGAQGKFLSEDPIFLAMGSTSTAQQSVQSVLSDPQSLNSYSYASDNPVNEADPTGQCPWCLTAAVGAATAVTGQFAFDMFTNVQTSGLNIGAYHFLSGQTYFTRAIQGAVIGATGGLIGGLAGVGIAGQMAISGGLSGAVGIAGNAYLHQPITVPSVAVDTTLGAAGFGAEAEVPNAEGFEQSTIKFGLDAASNYLGSVMTELFTSPTDFNKNLPIDVPNSFTTPHYAGYYSHSNPTYNRP